MADIPAVRGRAAGGANLTARRVPIAMEPEAELVVRGARYEADALGEIFDRHYPALFRYAFARLGETKEAEAAATEGLNRALAVLPSYQDRGADLRIWLYRCVHQAIIERHRGGVVASRGPEAPLRAALATLSPDQQEVLTLRFICGLTPEEIAAVSGRRSGAVIALQHRGLQALRRALSAPKEAEA
jgi:RNA polymerase sigma-70 factor (ECF subfamily)